MPPFAMVVCDNDDDVLFLGEKQQKRRAHKNTGDTYEMMTMTLKKKKRRRRREREGASSSFRIMRHSTRVSFLFFRLAGPPVFLKSNFSILQKRFNRNIKTPSSRFGEGKEDKESTKKHPHAPTLLLTTRELL